MKSTGIYAIRCIASGKAYIGSAKWIENRWAVHRKALREGKHHSQKLQHAWNKHGESAFAFEIIEITSIATLLQREQFHLDITCAADRDAGYNIVRTAGSPLGFVHGPEMRAKLSAALTGRKFTDEHRSRISAALKGRKPSPQAMEATSRYWKGRPSSKRLLNEDRIAQIKIDRAAGMSIKALAEKYGCSTQPIRNALSGAYV